MLALAVTALCAFAVARMVIAERAGDVNGRWRWKPVASAAFIAVPLLGGALGASAADSVVARLVVAGLCLGALGDLALLVEDRRGFLGGLVAFLLGHLCYVAAFARVTPIGAWFGGAMMIVVAAAAIAVVVILRWLWPKLGELRIPVIVYIAVISAMAIGGLAASLRGGGPLDGTARGLLTVGAVAFYLSDLAVARETFQGRDPWNRIIGLPVYYGAQLLFAWAVVPH